MQFIVTPEAASAAKLKLTNRGTPEAMIRLGVKGGACSGFSYIIEFEDREPSPRDVLITQGTVTFVIDKKSLSMLVGTQLTWKKTLMHEGFDFENPNESSRCGCGLSFSLK